MGDCGRPEDVLNGGWKKCGAGVSYFCNEGYRIIGETDLLCVDGRFTSSRPICEGEFASMVSCFAR